MRVRKTGFVVVYQWRLKAGKEAEFHQAWEALTRSLMKERGARGSRLHATEDGTVLAYAQWPDKRTWEASCALHEQDEKLSQQILDAVEETWSPMFLTTLSDHLLAEPNDEAAPRVTH